MRRAVIDEAAYGLEDTGAILRLEAWAPEFDNAADNAQLMYMWALRGPGPR